jgi:WD40 repeat protein
LSVAFDAQGQRLASAGDDGTVRVWSPSSSAKARVLEGHRGSVRSVAFDAQGQRLASAGDDGTVRIWSLSSNAEARVLEGHHGSVSSVAFDAQGQRLASAGDDGTVRLWNARTLDLDRILIPAADGGWAILWPDGTVAGDAAGLALITWADRETDRAYCYREVEDLVRHTE